jgi:hydrogenase nickel incorporation protein HypA/HybF
MHEWALAESILAAAETAAADQHLNKISKITVNLGELQHIDRSILRFALTELTSEHPRFTTTRFHFKTEKTTFSCTACHHRFTLADIKQKLTADEAEAIHFIPEAALSYVRCPHCGSPDYHILTGRGVTLATITGE